MPLPVLPACLPARRRVSARAWAASGRPCRRAGGRAAGLGFTLGGGNQSASLGSTSLTGWLTYRVLDESGNEQASGRDYLLGTGQWEYLQTGVRIAQAGTIEVMAGTSGSGEAVYFDNLRVEQSGGLIVQEQHQYAYGAPLPGLSYVVGSKRYRYGYQGQFAERDSVTGFESFELRLYNSRVGRWLSYDPEGQFNSPYVGMGNNTVSNVDPDGGRVPLPKFRSSYALRATSSLSNLTKWGMRAGSSLLRSASSYLEKGDAWVHSDAGENFARRAAEWNPVVTGMNVVSSVSTGENIFGEKRDKVDIAGDAIGIIPEEKVFALGGKVVLKFAKPLLASHTFAAVGAVVVRTGTRVHHIASNKSKVFTKQFEALLPAGLKLKEKWNLLVVPYANHYSNHPEKYHQFVLRGMQRASKEAKGDVQEFIKLFHEYITEPLKQNLDMLNKTGW